MFREGEASLGEKEDPDRKLLSVEEKSLKTVARYSMDLTVNKKAMREAHRIEQNQSSRGRLASFKEWCEKKWRVAIYKTETGITIELSHVEE